MAASGRTGARSSITRVVGWTTSTVSLGPESRRTDDASRVSEMPMAGWAPGYKETARAAALQARANSASAALWSPGIGCRCAG